MKPDKKVIIVIPIYRELYKNEAFALDNNLHVFREYPTVFLKPKGLNIEILKEKYPQIGEVEVSDLWLGKAKGIAGYNEMMMSADFYNMFVDYEYMLICQTDVWVFRDELPKWLEMGIDNVGAPWPLRKIYSLFPMKQYLELKIRLKPKEQNLRCQMFGRIGNGGFCLRKVKVFRDLCLKYAQEIEFYNSQTGPLYNEDIFWALVPKELKLPTIEEAVTFSFDNKVKTCYQMNHKQLPMAAHGYEHKHRRKFWMQFIPKEAFKDGE